MSLIFDPPVDPNDLAGRRVTLIGYGKGRTGAGLARWLVELGAKVTLSDRKRREELQEGVERLRAMGIEDRVELAFGPSSDDAALAHPEFVFVMPGIRPRSATLLRARELEIPILTEIGLFFRLCPAPIVGITGTKGKSTTTTIVGRILERGPRRVIVGGNIGRSVIEELPTIGREDIVVLELSSFQLETLGRSPHVAVITNVLEDHLDHHGTREAYVAAKGNILRWQGPRDVAVLDLEDPTAVALHTGTSQLRGFSLTMRPRHGAYLDEAGRLVLADGERPTVVCAADELRIPGRHNVANALAAMAAAGVFGIAAGEMADVLRTFEGLPHRLETVGEHEGVLYVNDSQATTPYATIPALSAFTPRMPVVILGGVSKDADFRDLGREVVLRARAAVVMGATGDEIAQAIEAAARPNRIRYPVERASSLDDAVARARRHARAGDVVLLSPACATGAGRADVVDEFASYAERGDRFREIVAGLGASRQPA